jgi:hypothetical protein
MTRKAPAWLAPGQRGVIHLSITNIANDSLRVHAKTASEILRDNRIVTQSAAVGRYYTACPQCSSKRKKAHQKLQCLGVTIGNEGIRGSSGASRPSRLVASTAVVDRSDEQQRTRIALELWNASQDPRNTIVEEYLVRRCGKLPDELASRVIRLHPSLKLDGNQVGAMVALHRDIHTDEPCAVHRTFVDRSGNKIGRKMLGRVSGSAIKLDVHEDVTLGLHLGEGVETCLSGYLRGLRPTWCLGSAGPIGDFPVLAGIESLTIFGELGDGGTNRRNAERCAARWRALDREVLWVRPLTGSDLNDALNGGAREKALSSTTPASRCCKNPN